MTLHVTVDGRQVELPDGAYALDAVLAAGVDLPHLCKDPDRPRLGTCRTCLVAIEGMYGAIASCAIPATEGMVIHTDDEAVVRVRSGVLQLTLDMVTERDFDRLGELGHAAQTHDLQPGRWTPAKYGDHRTRVDDSNPIWLLDHNRCILCERCLDACQGVQRIFAIAKLQRDGAARIGTFQDGPIITSNCTSCGQCWATCPTLAIRLKEPLAATAVLDPAFLEPVPRKRREKRHDAHH